MYKFQAYGHPNITAKHKTTFEFTKDKELSLKGDCIIGVKADFSLPLLKKFIKSLNNEKIKIIIKSGKFEEIINAELNPDFNSDKEMVIRKSEFKDERTFAIKADKAAFELNKALIDFLKEKNSRIIVFLKNKEK